MLNYIKKNSLAAFETALFLKRGTQGFSKSKMGMKLSFLVPLAALPVTFIMVIYGHPTEKLSDNATQILTLVYTLRLFMSLALYLGFIYIVAKSMDKMCSFRQFITANNWLTLPTALIMLPFLGLFLSGSHTWTEIYPMLVLITLYSYACTAFMAAHVMRIPMELAGFIAISGMAIHQTSLDVVKWAAVNIVNAIA